MRTAKGRRTNERRFVTIREVFTKISHKEDWMKLWGIQIWLRLGKSGRKKKEWHRRKNPTNNTRKGRAANDY